MKVFLSWSGDQSRQVAEALRDWIPYVIQSVVPFMSSEDIEKGSRGLHEIAQQLKDSKVGIICLTRENIYKPWINFEAGAISKNVKETYVCPYLFNLEPLDFKGPLAQFQTTKAEKDDTERLLKSINNADSEPLIPEERLCEIFEKWWPDLDKKLNKITKDEKDEIVKMRDDREILDEILEVVRKLDRKNSYVPDYSSYNKKLTQVQQH